MITLIIPIQSPKHRIVFVEGKTASFLFDGGEWVFLIPSGLNLPIQTQFSPVTKPEIKIELGRVSGLVLFSVLILMFVFGGGVKDGSAKA